MFHGKSVEPHTDIFLSLGAFEKKFTLFVPIFKKLSMSEKQTTLAKDVTLRGKGLHTGVDVTITFRPAPANSGYRFCRVDLPGKPLIDAIADNVTETSRGTTLVQGEASVATIEHVLAAFSGMQDRQCTD